MAEAANICPLDSGGEKWRKFDDLAYKREDCGEGGTHPTDSGQLALAQQLLKFFTMDPTAEMWFVRH